MPDGIQDAVDQVDGTRTVVQVEERPAKKLMTTGRYFQLNPPPNATPIELLDIAQWLTNVAIRMMATEAAPQSSKPHIALPGNFRVGRND